MLDFGNNALEVMRKNLGNNQQYINILDNARANADIISLPAIQEEDDEMVGEGSVVHYAKHKMVEKELTQMRKSLRASIIFGNDSLYAIRWPTSRMMM
jgi:hypothetical protein